MQIDWESNFSKWAAPPSQTEQDKCQNVERAVRKAIEASETLRGKNIQVFAQGSYANRTNVRQDSDVDVCVLCTDSFFPDYTFSQNLDNKVLGITSSSYSYATYKNDVGTALTTHFGSAAVKRGNKAFDIHANTCRVDADVVACFEHRRYIGTPQNPQYLSGTRMLPDNGGNIVNWPRQNYENGVSKNDATGKRFKAITRILKSLRNEMSEKGYSAADPIPSFLIECLVWNVPNNTFGQRTYSADIRSAIAHLWSNTRTNDSCQSWGEVNELKYLFRPSQPWTRDNVNNFLQSAWNYIGFK